MKTDEIVRLTRKRVAALVRSRQEQDDPDLFEGRERRENLRWPFPGAVELWPTGGDGRERWYGTCRNLSMNGLAMVTDEPFTPGAAVEIACHFPEASFYGEAVVRHCTQVPQGFLVGVEFRFPS